MRAFFAYISIFSMSALTACQHFDPVDTVRQEKYINIAIVNNQTYRFISSAHCEITLDSDKTVHTKRNPDAILLAANYKRLTLNCKAAGYQQQAIAITNTINHWSAPDLFILPGDVVDTTSSLLPYYPSHVLVLMSHTPFASEKTTEKNYNVAKENNILYQGTVA